MLVFVPSSLVSQVQRRDAPCLECKPSALQPARHSWKAFPWYKIRICGPRDFLCSELLGYLHYQDPRRSSTEKHLPGMYEVRPSSPRSTLILILGHAELIRAYGARKAHARMHARDARNAGHTQLLVMLSVRRPVYTLCELMVIKNVPV